MKQLCCWLVMCCLVADCPEAFKQETSLPHAKCCYGSSTANLCKLLLSSRCAKNCLFRNYLNPL